MSDKKRWIICTILACILIGIGIFQAVTNIQIDPQIVQYIQLGIMLGVLYFLVIYPYNSSRNKEINKSEKESTIINNEQE